MKILIGGAWPYANGSLHIGHIAALLPGDVLARYHRAVGNDVYYVSGSDCHGTPVSLRAKQENRTPREVGDTYHDEFKRCFARLGFSYDYYTKTSSEEHVAFVTRFHHRLYESGYIDEKNCPEAFCENCQKVLVDRYVVGGCPTCGERARGDQCDRCGTVIEPEQLHTPVCALCGAPIVFQTNKHLYLSLTKLADELRHYVDVHANWRRNAVAFSKRYINEGLRDRAITRSLDWGIPVPRDGYEDKKVYIWAENVLGYLSASRIVCEQRGTDFNALWGRDARHYYVHGKDNIPFHTIILPALLQAHGGYRLPDDIVSSEYLTLEGRKISTSQQWAIWVRDIIERYDPDSLRFYLLTNGPERRDADFSWRDYIQCHNSELLGAYGNLVNRTLAFIAKSFGSEVPVGRIKPEIEAKVTALFGTVGHKIENAQLKDALEEIYELVHFGNKYFDSEKPWETLKTNKSSCEEALFNCVQIIASLALLLEPYLPFTSGKLRWALSLKAVWKPQYVAAGQSVPPLGLLFERIDKSVVDDEVARLNANNARE